MLVKLSKRQVGHHHWKAGEGSFFEMIQPAPLVAPR